MSIDYYFRPLALNDLTGMMQIEREVFELPWSAGQMKDSLLAAHCQTWGVFSELSGDLIGFGILSVVLEEVELLTLEIGKKFQRRNYGEKLLNFLMDKAREARAEKFFLEVPESNSPALELYFKTGFLKIGRRENYYSKAAGELKEAAILMLKNL